MGQLLCRVRVPARGELSQGTRKARAAQAASLKSGSEVPHLACEVRAFQANVLLCVKVSAIGMHVVIQAMRVFAVSGQNALVWVWRLMS